MFRDGITELVHSIVYERFNIKGLFILLFKKFKPVLIKEIQEYVYVYKVILCPLLKKVGKKYCKSEIFVSIYCCNFWTTMSTNAKFNYFNFVKCNKFIKVSIFDIQAFMFWKLGNFQ